MFEWHIPSCLEGHFLGIRLHLEEVTFFKITFIFVTFLTFFYIYLNVFLHLWLHLHLHGRRLAASAPQRRAAAE